MGGATLVRGGSSNDMTGPCLIACAIIGRTVAQNGEVGAPDDSRHTRSTSDRVSEVMVEIEDDGAAHAPRR